MSTNCLLSILEEVPCRKKEVELLVNLLGEPDDPVPASIFISGHKSSGKSYTVQKVLQHMKIPYANVSCIETYIPSLLFDPILNQLTGYSEEDSEAEKPLIETRCDNMMDFILQLNSKAKEDEIFMNQKHVIVLEEAEYIREMAPNLLPAFLKLQELTLLKRICVILVTTLVFEKFCPPEGLSIPIQVYFPQYVQSELLKILMLDCPPQYPHEFYHHYLHLFLSVFFRACRDLRELRYKAAVNFTKYCEPIESGKVQMQDASKLWHFISPHFKTSLEVVYMRTEMIEAQKEAQKEGSHPSDSADHPQPISASARYALSFELPFYAKYLLTAAYLASYNSPKEDKKIFVKLSGKTKKKMPKQKKNSVAKLSLQVSGPRIFDMGRLLAIFYAIIEKKPSLSVNLLSQISTLVDLQLIHRCGEETLENPKFKCAVGLDFIIIITKTLHFNVTKYLVDYK